MKIIYIILTFALLLISFFIKAQVKDTIHLPSVEVAASSFQLKDQQFNTGKKIQTIDSIIHQVYALNTLSDILNYQTSVFVKNYAPGSISSTSIRGGNAQQTIVLWNGININSPMLGQADFSQYPAGLFDNISIEYGASSSLWGSGAINGAIRLEQNLSKNQNSYIQYRYGSFNSHQFLSKINCNINKFQFQIQPYYSYSKNNYLIRDSIELKHADFNNKGITTSAAYQWKNHKLQIHSWYNENNRNIPNNYFFNTYASHQLDKNFRNVLDYIYSKNTWESGIKLSYINDILNYTDTLARIYSYSNVHTFQTEENIYKFISNIQISAGHQWIYNLAITNNYLNNETLNRHSVYAGIKHQIKKFKYNIIIRKEWANISSAIPVTGNIGAEISLNKFLSLKTQASTFYRIPTLNDLFWKGSGDKTLQPESGYHYEGGLVLNIKINQLHSEFFSELTAFNKYTDNWIMWLPGGSGQPVPANLSNVWSRGTETNNYLLIHYKNGKIKTGISSAYILSTIEKSKMNNDASIGKQLIYTPRYNINGSLQVFYKKTFLLFTHQYVGYRFISSDNLQYLEPYYISNFSIGQKLSYKKISFQLVIGINNIFNTSYMIVSQRPMPGRNYFIQLTAFFNNKTTRYPI